MRVQEKVIGGPLQNVSVLYKNTEYIADRVFPLIDRVGKESKITIFRKGDRFRDEAGTRAPGTRANRGSFELDYKNINPVNYSFAEAVKDEDRRASKEQGAPPLDPDRDAVEYATDKVDLKKERKTARSVLESTWSGVSGGTDLHGAWAAGDGNTFISEIEARKELIRSQTGVRPNVLILSANILPEAKKEKTLLEKIQWTERGIITPALIAALLELDEVLIGDAIYNIAPEKKDEDNFIGQNVWEKNQNKGAAFLFHRPRRAGLRTPAAGYQARRPINGKIREIVTWREPAEHQDVYEVAEETDIAVVGPDLGYLWIDCIAD